MVKDGPREGLFAEFRQFSQKECPQSITNGGMASL
jgi:hypothetical protein